MKDDVIGVLASVNKEKRRKFSSFQFFWPYVYGYHVRTGEYSVRVKKTSEMKIFQKKKLLPRLEWMKERVALWCAAFVSQKKAG